MARINFVVAEKQKELFEEYTGSDPEFESLSHFFLEDDVDEAYQQSTPSLSDDPSGQHLEQKCEICGKTRSKMVTHHVSYKLEEVMEICSNCHLEIHQEFSEYSHLMPDISPKKAEEKGWI